MTDFDWARPADPRGGAKRYRLCVGHQRDRMRRPETVDVPSAVLRTGIDAHRQSVRDHVLSLQRGYGNNAVISVLQRKPHDTAASTDAPGHKAPPKKQAEPDYFPTERNYPSWTADRLRGEVKDYPDTKEQIFALEDLWMLGGSERLSFDDQLGRSYGKRGDEKRSAFWYKVAHREIKPRDPDDQTGKGD